MIPWFPLVTVCQLESLTAGLSQSWVLGVPGTHLPPSPSSFFQGMQKWVMQHIPEPVALEGLKSRPSLRRHEDHVSSGAMGQQPKMGGGLSELQDIRRGAGGGEGLEWGGDVETPPPQFPRPPTLLEAFLVGILRAARWQSRGCALFSGRGISTRLWMQ